MSRVILRPARTHVESLQSAHVHHIVGSVRHHDHHGDRLLQGLDLVSETGHLRVPVWDTVRGQQRSHAAVRGRGDGDHVERDTQPHVEHRSDTYYMRLGFNG